jgi:hypothetical protein
MGRRQEAHEGSGGAGADVERADQRALTDVAGDLGRVEHENVAQCAGGG